MEIDAIYETPALKVARVKPTPFLNTYCKNKVPHITLWVGEGAQAVHANDVFDDPTVSVTHVTQTMSGIVTIVSP